VHPVDPGGKARADPGPLIRGQGDRTARAITPICSAALRVSGPALLGAASAMRRSNALVARLAGRRACSRTILVATQAAAVATRAITPVMMGLVATAAVARRRCAILAAISRRACGSLTLWRGFLFGGGRTGRRAPRL
jgi:hypothetical protein